VRVEVGHRFAVPLRDSYDYITDLEKWPEYWPGLVRVAPESRWSAPGDQARVVVRLLGRPVELEMSRIEPYRLIEYSSVQRGLPDARHERHFVEENSGFAYRIVVEINPRRGLRGLFDRLVVRRAVERAARQTIANLEARAAALKPRVRPRTARFRPHRLCSRLRVTRLTQRTSGTEPGTQWCAKKLTTTPHT
jgi:hypothetical protein